MTGPGRASAAQAPRLLFLSLFNDVGSERIVASMAKLGARCAVMSAPDAFAAQTRFVERLYPLPKRGGAWVRCLGLGARLARANRTFQPDIVIPLDEFSAGALRDPKLFRRASPADRALLKRSFGEPETFAATGDRHHLVRAAEALGLATPTQIAVADLDGARDAAASLGYPVVLKRDQTCGGAGVTILRSADELMSTFRHADAKAQAKRRVQKLLGRDTGKGTPLVLQRHVVGQLAFRIVACRDGRVLDGISFLSARVHPPVTGASTVLEPIERADMAAATATLVASLGCSGLVSLDFILPATGPAVFIEMNPRPVASGHLGRLFGHDIYAALLDEIRGTETIRAPEPALSPTQIALFPRELDRDPRSALAQMQPPAGALHDVPWDDTTSIAAHVAWLSRRHPTDLADLTTALGRMPSEKPGRRRQITRAMRAITAVIGRLIDHRGPASAK